jgi:thiol-disulfide isomerase/thioredoxin
LKRILAAMTVLLAMTLGQSALASKAVNFTFTDMKGKVIRLSDLRGKWVLINFWAPWCPRCWMEFPTLNDLDARKDFVVIGMAMDYSGDQSSVSRYVQRYGLRYPQVLGGDRHDPKSPALQVGPVDFYPTSYLYDPNGELVMFIPGLVSKQKMVAFIGQYSQDFSTTAVADAGPVAAVPGPIKPAKFSGRHGSPQATPTSKKKLSM